MAPIHSPPGEAALPDQFLYNRKGPWPQPSPSFPLECADEVLHVPPMEELLFSETIGKRYVETQMQFRPAAAKLAAWQVDNWTGIPDADFRKYMTRTVFTRFSKPVDSFDGALFRKG